MSKRYLQWGYESFKDTKTGEIYDNHIDFLNKQDQRIAELEEQLKDSIIPKFKIGQEVWGIDVVRKDNIDSFIVREICYCADYGLYYKTDIGVNVYEYYYQLFATKEEAQAKLKELTTKM